jgi:hypothetical protein
MLVIRSGTILFSLLKAPSAIATVGYLAVGLTLPFAAAYKEKYDGFLMVLMVGNILRGGLSMHGSAHMEVIVDYDRNVWR